MLAIFLGVSVLIHHILMDLLSPMAENDLLSISYYSYWFAMFIQNPYNRNHDMNSVFWQTIICLRSFWCVNIDL